jgi:phosphatidylglycerophosphate synthase
LFAFDPLLLNHMAKHPEHVLVKDGQPVIASVSDQGLADPVARAMEAGEPLPPEVPLVRLVHDDQFELYNRSLRKRERPCVTPLTPANVPGIERASYFAAYKGVTDILTKYLWPEWALVLTRLCARVGLTPNMVTTIGAAFCVLATWLFYEGRYWEGMAAGLVFMVLDTVDGKLARCTITSSFWGNIFDHGIDQVHPLFWWLSWAAGLSNWGLAYSHAEFTWITIAIVAGYILQRLIEGYFVRRFGMHIHVWQKIDSDFRLITARRNPNMVILFVGTAFGRPDAGLEMVAWWTVLSCLFHAVRLMQAERCFSRGVQVRTWLD